MQRSRDDNSYNVYMNMCFPQFLVLQRDTGWKTGCTAQIKNLSISFTI